MIRHVVVIRLKPSATAGQVADIESALAAMEFPGRLSFTMGRDLGLRPGNMDVAIVVDLDSVDAYRTYDALEEHNRIRRELIAPVADSVERCTFEL